MSVIDLLNKIAKGERVPKKIKYQYIIFEWDNVCKTYQEPNGDYLSEHIGIDDESLNWEIEIIED